MCSRTVAVLIAVLLARAPLPGSEPSGDAVTPARAMLAGGLPRENGTPPAAARLGIPPAVYHRLPPGCRSCWSAPPRFPQPVQTAAGPGLSLLSEPDAEDDVQGGPDDPSLLDGDSLLPADDPLEGDALQNLGPRGSANDSPHGAGRPPANSSAGADPHAAMFADERYPAATSCKACHPQHYDQWRASAHAYAAISPMFQSFEQAITELSQGTIGHFCVRCHAPVGTQAGMPRSASILDAPQVVREGITCIACHRVREAYGKTNGERRIEPGDIYAPIYGPVGGSGVAAAVADRDHYKVKTSADGSAAAQPLHREGRFFESLTRSDFCAPCHQVAVHPGIGLEVVYNQYRASPAAAQGVTCQDCHMGKVPGKPQGYAWGPIAELAGKPFGSERKQSNHAFWGPGVSIAHPGLFPHNDEAERWSPRQWLRFDWRGGWGTEAFERSLDARPEHAAALPPPWDHADERRDARRIIDANLRRLEEKRRGAIATMENALRIEGPRFDQPPHRHRALQFSYQVQSLSAGHNLPSGSLGAQPQLWLNVVLIGPGGERLWESGHLDAYGDLADMHSRQVRRGEMPPDLQLLNLQSKFLVTGAKGTDREMFLPINIDIDQVPLLRPGAVPVSVLNHPPGIRMEAHSIPPRGQKTAHYTIPPTALRGPGTYRLSVRMRSRMEPPYFMAFCRATPEMIRRMNEQILDLHRQSFTFHVR